MALLQKSSSLFLLCVVAMTTTCRATDTASCPQWKCDALNDQIEAATACLHREIVELRNNFAEQTDALKNEIAELRTILDAEGLNATSPVPTQTTTTTESGPAGCGDGVCTEDTSNVCVREQISAREVPGFANYTSDSSSGYMISCQTTNFQGHEVYGVGLYERYRYSNIDGVELYLRLPGGATAHPVKLLLASYDPINWKIYADPCVDVREVLMVAYNEDDSSVEVVGEAAQPTVTKIHDYVSYGHMVPTSSSSFDYYERHWTDLTQYAVDNFGFLTSFVGTYAAAAFSINVGLQC